MNIVKDFLENYKYGYTHGGNMHSDEVFVTAFLEMINPQFKVYRQKNRFDVIPKNKDILVFDVGNGFYDHHNNNIKYRDNNIKFASFGLVLYAFGHQLGLTDSQILELDKKFVEDMDYSDNEGTLNDYVTLIDRFNPAWNSSNKVDERFKEAVKLAKVILEKEIYNLKNNIKHNNTIEQIEDIYIKAFLNIVDIKDSKFKTLIDNYEYYAKDILSLNEVILMKNKIIRYHKLFKSKICLKDNMSGFLQIVNNYDLNNSIECYKIIKIVEKILLRDILRTKSDYESSLMVEKIYKNAESNYIILPYSGMSWTKVVTTFNNSDMSKDIDYVIFPTTGDEYGIKAVPKKYNNKKILRKAFPLEWRGLTIDELKKVDKDFLFCHLSGFFCSVKSLESALHIINILNKNTPT